MNFLSNPKLLSLGVIGLTALAYGKSHFNGGVCKIEKNLSGKIVVITGANTGIGKETARSLAKMKATVIFACRDEKRTIPVIEEIKTETNNNNLFFYKLELDNLKSIKQFSEDFQSRFDRIDILINNAGVMRIPTRTLTANGFEMQIGVNHFGHFYLTKLLLDRLKKAAPSRIINVSSRAHERGKMDWDDLMLEKDYEPQKCYCQSKLANILFTRQLQEIVKNDNIKVVTLHPGVVRTELGRYMFDTTAKKVLMNVIKPLFWYFTKDSVQGAQTTLYCALEEHNKLVPGGYYSDCKIMDVNPIANEPENWKKLWDISEELIKKHTS